MIGAYHSIYSMHMDGIKAYKKNTESWFNKVQVDPFPHITQEQKHELKCQKHQKIEQAIPLLSLPVTVSFEFKR